MRSQLVANADCLLEFPPCNAEFTDSEERCSEASVNLGLLEWADGRLESLPCCELTDAVEDQRL